jgi:hypothetical protein
MWSGQSQISKTLMWWQCKNGPKCRGATAALLFVNDHHGFAIYSCFPPELEREAFELAAELDRTTIPLLVSRECNSPIDLSFQCSQAHHAGKLLRSSMTTSDVSMFAMVFKYRRTGRNHFCLRRTFTPSRLSTKPKLHSPVSLF